MALGQGLTVWTTTGGQTLQWLRGTADSFTDNFDVSVSVVELDLGELLQQALVGAPRGEAGDVFVGIPHDNLDGLAEGGVLADTSAYVTNSYVADLSEQARLAFTHDGQLLGLPMWVEGPALIVNTNLVPSVPETYEDFIALAQEFTTADSIGFMVDATNFYFAYGWLHTFGGYVFGRDASGSFVVDDVGLANDGAVRGAQALKDLRYAYDLIASGTPFDVANRLFLDGSVAMIYNGNWAISEYRAAGLDVSVAPIPPLADGTPFSGFMGVHGVAINQFSTNKVAAANFAKWITSSDAQASLARMSGRIPASEGALAMVSDEPIIFGFGTALLDSEPLPNIPRMGQVWGPMGNALTLILESSDSDVRAVLEEARREIVGN